MKASRFVGIVAAVTIGFGGSLVAATPASAAVPGVPDSALSVCIHDTVLGALGQTITNLLDSIGLSAVSSLLNGPLLCSGKGVVDLTGLNQLGNLDQLDLSDNAITDITKLAGLADLDDLDLSGNGITDLSLLRTIFGSGTDIDATGQVIHLADSVVGEPILLPVLKGLTAGPVPITDVTGGVVGVIDTVNGTVTFLSAGVGELTFQLGAFTGTLLSTVTNKSFGTDVSASITGASEFAAVLTAVPAGFPDGTAFAYTWTRDTVTIPGATAESYTLGASDIGTDVAVSVTATKDGYNAKTVHSEPTRTIRKGTISPAPVPTITGSAIVGTTLTASAGTWAGGVTLSYRWLRAGAAIASATSSTYVPTSADLGKAISVAVTGTRENYTTLVRTSAPTAAVITAPITPDSSKTGTTTTTTTTTGGTTGGTTTTVLKTFAKTYAPKISGTAKVGKKLTAKTVKWSKKVTFGYQWKANGKAIPKATKKAWTVTKKYVGKKITVVITAKLSGYASVARTSKSTAKVRI